MSTDNDTGATPHPEYRRAGVRYPCAKCGRYVKPDDGDTEAAILIGGLQRKLCEECARDFQEQILEANHGDDG